MPKRQFITFALCLVCSTILLPATLWSADQNLYKWEEPDGTLTFSPVPPPKSSGIAFEKVEINKKKNTAKLEKTMPSTAKPFVSKQRIPAITPTANKQPTRSRQKTAQCAELRKRVVSLERLIRTDVSDERMDNAVVQMARYQASYNRACDKFRH